jgi:hypothetical protein
MHTSLAMQTCRSFRAQICKSANINKHKHPVLDFTNIQKVYRYDTTGPIDNTWTRWLKVNHKDGTCMRIDYGHTQSGATFRDQLVAALTTLGFLVSNKK